MREGCDNEEKKSLRGLGFIGWFMTIAFILALALILIVFIHACCCQSMMPNKYRITKQHDIYRVESCVGFLPVWMVRSNYVCSTQEEAEEDLKRIKDMDMRQHSTPVVIKEYKVEKK